MSSSALTAEAVASARLRVGENQATKFVEESDFNNS